MTRTSHEPRPEMVSTTSAMRGCIAKAMVARGAAVLALVLMGLPLACSIPASRAPVVPPAPGLPSRPPRHAPAPLRALRGGGPKQSPPAAPTQAPSALPMLYVHVPLCVRVCDAVCALSRAHPSGIVRRLRIGSMLGMYGLMCAVEHVLSARVLAVHLPGLVAPSRLLGGAVSASYGLVVLINVCASSFMMMYLSFIPGGARRKYMEAAKKKGDRDAEARFSHPKLYAEGFSQEAKEYNWWVCPFFPLHHRDSPLKARGLPGALPLYGAPQHVRGLPQGGWDLLGRRDKGQNAQARLPTDRQRHDAVCAARVHARWISHTSMLARVTGAVVCSHQRAHQQALETYANFVVCSLVGGKRLRAALAPERGLLCLRMCVCVCVCVCAFSECLQQTRASAVCVSAACVVCLGSRGFSVRPRGSRSSADACRASERERGERERVKGQDRQARFCICASVHLRTASQLLALRSERCVRARVRFVSLTVCSLCGNPRGAAAVADKCRGSTLHYCACQVGQGA